MKRNIMITFSVLGFMLFLFAGGCEEPKKSKSKTPPISPPPAGTEVAENIKTDVTIEPNGIGTFTFTPATSGAYLLYILDVNATFEYKCDFAAAGEKGERTGEHYCLFSSLAGGVAYGFSLESYASRESNLSLLLVHNDVTDTTLLEPLHLELNSSETTRVGAYRNTGYFSFSTSDISSDIRVYVQKEEVPLTMKILSGGFTGIVVYDWTIPAITTDTIAPVTGLDKNTTYYMTAYNGGTTYTDLILKVDHYPEDENETDTPTPSTLAVGVKYEGLELTDRQNRYEFKATSQEHNITLTSDALLWTLYAPIGGTYEVYFRCWSSAGRKTRCTVYDLTPGTTYRLYVGCFFAPQCTPEHTLLIE